MNVFFASLASQAVSSLPCHFLAYYAFRDRLRYKVRKIVALIFFIQGSADILYACTASIGVPRRWLEFLSAPFIMLLFFRCVRADKFKLLFLYIFVLDYAMIVRGTAAFLGVRIFHDQSVALYAPANPLLQLTILAVSYPFMLHFFDNAKNQALQVDAPVFWRTAWMGPALTAAVVLIYTGAFTLEQVQSWQFFVVRLLPLICMFAAYSSLLRSLDSVRRQAALAEQAALQENMLALQRTQYDQLMRHMEQVRAARHDLRHHCEAVRAYVEGGDKQGLLAYLNTYERDLPANTQQLFSKNFAVNAVLNYYAEAARREQTEFSANINLPGALPVSEPELCALLGNLLENALDACRAVTKAVPFIRIGGYVDGNHIVLTVDNSCAEEPVEENGRFLSGKHAGYGIGTFSVRSVAERTGGTAEFSCRDGVFYASVLLYGPKKEELQK